MNCPKCNEDILSMSVHYCPAKEKADDRLARTPCYLIERKHRTIPDKWRVVGEFKAGSPWRDERPVNDETMREEVKGYERTWTRYEARVRCPNGEILSDNAESIRPESKP